MKSIQKIAKERIISLFEKSEKEFPKNSKLSDRYVEIARKIAMKSQISLPSNLKKKFCRKCFKFLVPGSNSRVRIRNKKIVYSCLNCKNIMRFPYKK